MFQLKKISEVGRTRLIQEEDRDAFKTLEFDPNELLQLKEMDHEELKGLMVFCGVRVYNGFPLCVLEADEMRLAYISWRFGQIEECKEKIAPKLERRFKWLNFCKDAIEIAVAQ